jgi:hypothetical protein
MTPAPHPPKNAETKQAAQEFCAKTPLFLI